jgi:hypothetical protein
MVKIINNYLTHIQCERIINLWNDNNTINVSYGIYHFYGFDLIPYLKKVVNIIPELSKCNFKKFRIQYTDETIEQVKTTHTHINTYSFIIFLNDNFKGGELVFNELIVKPKIGTMVYFTGDEAHKVQDCIGKRFTLVGFLHNDLFKIKNTIL